MHEDDARADIQASLRKAPEVIEKATWANRTQRTRQPRNFYQAAGNGIRKRKWFHLGGAQLS